MGFDPLLIYCCWCRPSRIPWILSGGHGTFKDEASRISIVISIRVRLAADFLDVQTSWPAYRFYSVPLTFTVKDNCPVLKLDMSNSPLVCVGMVIACEFKMFKMLRTGLWSVNRVNL